MKFEKPKILEFGVRHGVSTSLFLDVCGQNNGNLYSVDVEDYSYQFKNEKWKFIQSKDDNFAKIEAEIPKEFDVIFLDTIHKSEHVSNILYYYYNKLKVGGLFIIDDISWLLYTKNNEHDHFFKEINNHETFKKILNIYNSNQEKFDIHFNFCDTGAVKIIKRKQDKLNESKIIYSRENTLKNYLRKLYIKFKK
jgi:predicted O-methyltransferase YrrM